MTAGGAKGREPDVSRETRARLETFAALVRKWTMRVNLVSRASLADLWRRHILDSVQVFEAAPPARLWADLGSGGGFPGVVVAILAAERAPEMRTLLIESDRRKAAFLRTALRETGVRGEVITARIEDLDPLNADVLSARALTDLDGLLAHAERHLAPGGTALFPKGVRWRQEVADAQRRWRFALEPIKSETEDGAVILKIQGVARG